jgi:hypothetical protein
MIIHFAQQNVIAHWAGGFLFLLMPKKTKHFTGPFQNGSVNLGNGNISYVPMNHFETATATR